MGRYKVNQTDGSLSLISGRGKAEYGASTVRKGHTTVSVTADTPSTHTITFAEPMPDANYIVEITTLSHYCYWTIGGKTANGFNIYIKSSVTSNEFNVSYTAFKLYTDTEYNELLERTDANELGAPVNILSYDSTSNKYTFPSDGYLSLNPTAHSGNRIGAVIYGAIENAPYLVAYGDSASANATFVKKGMRAIIIIKEGTDLVANFIPLV